MLEQFCNAEWNIILCRTLECMLNCSLMECAKEMIRESLPIKCLEAVILAMYPFDSCHCKATYYMAVWIKMPLGTGVGLGTGHIVTWGPSSFPKQGHSSPQFSVDVCCGQTVAWIKMPLGMEVGLGPGHIVLDGDLPPKGSQPPTSQFLAHVCCG